MADGLLPTTPTQGSIRIDRELPIEARTWKRVLDTSALEAGDLLLFREIVSTPDKISTLIMKAQIAGGLDERHAQWTHAAVYLGDDEHICEANIKVAGYPNGVILRSVNTYCDGNSAIRARRPKHMTQKQRLRIAIGALTNLGKRYNYLEIFNFWRAARSGKGFWQSTPRGPGIPSHGLVCSTLYQDAYNFAAQGATVRFGNRCTPGHLSACADFEDNDIPLSWLALE